MTQFSGEFSVNLFFREPFWAVAYLDNLAHVSLRRKGSMIERNDDEGSRRSQWFGN